MSARWQIAIAFVLAAGASTAHAESALDRAETAFYAGRFDEARTLAERIDIEQRAQAEVSPDRPRLLLLKSALMLRRNDAAAARSAMKAAMVLDPELDTSSYPPPLPGLADSVRLELPPRVIVKLTGVPADAYVRIDGRDAASGILSVLPGTHQLVVRGEARRTIIRSFQARKAITLDVGEIAGSSYRTKAGYALLGVSAASAVGLGVAQYDLSTTRANRADARGAPAHRFYDRHIERYQTGSGLAACGMIGAGAAGVWLLAGGRKQPSRRVAIGAFADPDGDAAVYFVARF